MQPFAHLSVTRLAAIVQAPAREDLIARALAATNGGITLLALPVTVPFVAEIAAEIGDGADVTVGLCDATVVAHLNLALAAGAQFVISPVFDPELIQTGRARGLAVLPSVTTANELQQALRIHDGPIAIAPIRALGGPEYLEFLLDAFPTAKLVALGGVGSDSAPQYIESGASAVVVDRGLFPAEMDPQAPAVIAARAGALVELCASAEIGKRQSIG
jgi:2-dehydro-3-deoxyphosphogluconate aldolase/(4S)-4-hydroxy-2-oxoglutarate aldolase